MGAIKTEPDTYASTTTAAENAGVTASETSAATTPANSADGCSCEKEG